MAILVKVTWKGFSYFVNFDLVESMYRYPGHEKVGNIPAEGPQTCIFIHGDTKDFTYWERAKYRCEETPEEIMQMIKEQGR